LFDTLARLAADGSRRDVLRSALALGLANLGAASFLRTEDSGAKKQEKQ
jgi:hypothetical protein